MRASRRIGSAGLLLLRLDQVHLQYGEQVLLDKVDLRIEPAQRIGLLGRNGAGKSTLLRVLTGDLPPDSGARWVRPGTRLALLEQALPRADQRRVLAYVAGGLAEAGALLQRYAELTAAPDADLAELEKVQHALESVDGWSVQQRVQRTLSELDLDGDATLASLSGGWRRRAALARALVGDPDILLLDEPSNHLDIPGIEWLGAQLGHLGCALVLITHDRRFLQGVAEHIAELDRGQLTLWRGDYRGFVQHRQQQLAAEDKANALFDRRLAQEERWIRQGIKARRTRNEGRVRALEAMREERRQRRERSARATLQVDTAERSGKRVAELEAVSVSLGGRPVLERCSVLIQRGDRVGIVGPNGAGKSTLIGVLTGELAPDSGRVRLGEKLSIAYGDQSRSRLDPEKNLIDNICQGREFVQIGGRQRHAVSYLGDFLFTPQRLRMPLGALSGGEQNRAVLAALFSRPVNLLVLDEPTNDLDIETLELLEERLMEFSGTVLLVSHDRAFMDNVVTSLLVLRGDGSVEEQAGGFSDWEARGGRLLPLPSALQANRAEPAAAAAKPGGAPRKKPGGKIGDKLSYKEERERSSLPAHIEALEARQRELERLSADPGFYERPRADIDTLLRELSALSAEIEAKLERWTELEDRA